MPVDPTDPSDQDAFTDPYEDEPDEVGLEAPDEDAVEQQRELLYQREAPITSSGAEEVDPADAAEQAHVVELDMDEYDEYR